MLSLFRKTVRCRLPRALTTAPPGRALKVTLPISGSPGQLSAWKVEVADRCLSKGHSEGLLFEQLLSFIKPKQVWGKRPG